jgi:D-xylose transport system permease protein
MTKTSVTETGESSLELSLRSPHDGSLREQLSQSWATIKGGNISGLTAVVGLLALSILFSQLSPFFATPLNFANLLTQAATLVMLAAALTFVLLLGEIDLSAGVTGGVGAAIFVILTASWDVNWILAIVISLIFGLVTGSLIGIFVAYVGIPSFVVTLGLFLGFQGLQLIIIGSGGLYRVETPQIMALMNASMPVLFGWILFGFLLFLYVATAFWDRSRRKAAGASPGPLSFLLVKVVALALVGGAVTFVLSVDRSQGGEPVRGVPWVVPLTLLILIVGTVVLKRTKLGRYIYAIGGNSEAARRAGIRVKSVMLSAFIICSSLAVVSGILTASRVGSVDAAAGREVVLSGVAAAVVGGVSLFGGRGSLGFAAVGALLVATITNGLGLLNLPAGINYAVTGIVLVAAASFDAIRRRTVK